MQQTWETVIENSTYIGDLYDFNGRRRVLLINKGVAVFAKCTIEDYYMMKDDFLHFLSEVEFVQAAKIQHNIAEFSDQLMELFDTDTIEEINHYLYQSLKALN